ncbi:serine hydrolase, partial [Vibrio parahaemolyticus]
AAAPAPKPVFVAPKPKPPVGMLASLEALAQGFDGRVGIAVTSIDKGWSLDVHGDERLPQQSVSKLWVALTVLDFRDQGRLTLDDPVTVTRED